MELTIKWQTIEPKEAGEYLICFKDGRVATDTLMVSNACWGTQCRDWQRFNKSYVIAWCKLSDIKPYKKE